MKNMTFNCRDPWPVTTKQIAQKTWIGHLQSRRVRLNAATAPGLDNAMYEIIDSRPLCLKKHPFKFSFYFSCQFHSTFGIVGRRLGTPIFMSMNTIEELIAWKLQTSFTS
jgi:hypothetical protein